MIFVSTSQFHIYLPCLGACLAKCPNSVWIVKALLSAFNKEKVIVKTSQTFVSSSNTHRQSVRWKYLLKYKIFLKDSNSRWGGRKELSMSRTINSSTLHW